MENLDLAARDGLPEALRVLLTEFPRDGWERDPGFHSLVSFWLDRHMAFRHLMAEMRRETGRLLDRQSDPKRFGTRLSRYGSHFVNDLHSHHQIEDLHYFPLLAEKDARIVRGFDILDKDHQALDGLLAGFVASANSALGKLDDREALQDAAGTFAGDLDRLERLIDRHLVDEEELIVPVILKYGAGGLA